MIEHNREWEGWWQIAYDKQFIHKNDTVLVDNQIYFINFLIILSAFSFSVHELQ